MLLTVLSKLPFLIYTISITAHTFAEVTVIERADVLGGHVHPGGIRFFIDNRDGNLISFGSWSVPTCSYHYQERQFLSGEGANTSRNHQHLLLESTHSGYASLVHKSNMAASN
jgi:hypothetical protein